ncbi:ABC transporter ATP-binding protein [Nesterenkonia flava]|uniref:ABC transporter ATP-binding protein n=1 Tax=Nesterenkonia flava TaxID=469799 RepID=A0ABU1FWQ6_9MICC|nr:ABC transporter ATP-binding protein [Nesterenkonia flava]MDR5712905.1 ABC transporter ATP-binding protein [Nesterenkonia flava]
MPQQAACLTLTQVRYAVGSGPRRRGAEGAAVKEILAGVDLTARRGEVTALIGPNGAGKTTTLSCAQGLLRPSAGEVRLLGQDPFRAGAQLRARVGVMLQDGGLPQSVQPKRLLAHVSRLHRDPWPLTDLIDRLDLGSFLTTNIRRLSGGQKQRVALAAALVGRPELVFLDEPSAGLDPQSRQMVFELIEHLRGLGLGIVLTTHLLEEAQRLADSVFILKDGVVVRHGTVAELTNGHSSSHEDDAAPTSRRLVFASPRILTRAELESAPLPLELDGDASNKAGARWAVYGVTSPQQLNALSQWWEAMDLMPAEISFEARTLEDVFWEVSTP